MTHQNAVETLAAERYLLDEMSELERYTFEEHFFDCDDCAEEMRLGSRLRSNAAALFLAAPTGRAAALARVVTAVASDMGGPVAQSSGAVGGGGGPCPRPDESGAPPERRADDGRRCHRMAPVSLRPATRGAVPLVALPPKSGSVALALDVNLGEPGEVIQ